MGAMSAAAPDPPVAVPCPENLVVPAAVYASHSARMGMEGLGDWQEAGGLAPPSGSARDAVILFEEGDLEHL